MKSIYIDIQLIFKKLKKDYLVTLPIRGPIRALKSIAKVKPNGIPNIGGGSGGISRGCLYIMFVFGSANASHRFSAFFTARPRIEPHAVTK